MMTVTVFVSWPEERVALNEWCEPGKRLHFVSLLENWFFANNCSIAGSYMETGDGCSN